MATASKALPSWATVGAKVLLERGGYRGDRVFYEHVVTRLTPTSVFVRPVEGGRERRFVDTGFHTVKDRLKEYGHSSSSWTPNTYIWNPEAPEILEAKKAALTRGYELRLAQAAEELAKSLRGTSAHPDSLTAQVQVLRNRITEWEVSRSGNGADQ